MKEEETLQYCFKPMLLTAITVLGFALTTVPAHAQSDGRVLALLPFDFSVGNATLKAGSYAIEQLQSVILALSSSDGKKDQFALTFSRDSDKESLEPHLVFIRYGSETFLKRVFFSGNEYCHELPESSRERKLINHQASGAELSLPIQPADCGDAGLAEAFVKAASRGTRSPAPCRGELDTFKLGMRSHGTGV